MLGGNQVSAYVHEAGVQESLEENRDAPIWKLRSDCKLFEKKYSKMHQNMGVRNVSVHLCHRQPGSVERGRVL